MGIIDICNVVFYCLYIIKPLGGCPILELEDHLTQSSPFPLELLF